MNSAQDIWDLVLTVLSQSLTPTSMNTWFQDCICEDFSNNCMTVSATTDLKRRTIEDRYAPQIKKILRDIFSSEIEFRMFTRDYTAALEEIKKKEAAGEGDAFSRIAGNYTFDHFIVGASNKFPHGVALAVAKDPGSINPVLFYGNSGLGKTHLMLAIGSQIHEDYPEKRIVYKKAEDFTNEMVHCIGNRTMEEFRAKYRGADVLLLDDIQFIGGKEGTQMEFFHTFDSLYMEGKQIVLTSDRPPAEIKTLESRIQTRLEGGVISVILPPDEETRMAIVKSKATLLGITMPDEGAAYIAQHITNNIRTIEGVVKKITAYHKLQNDPISLDTIKAAMQDVMSEGVYVPTIDAIIAETARYFGVEEDALRGEGRSKEIAQARQIAIHLCRQLTGESLEHIGKAFNRDHSTILHSVRKMEENVTSDKAISDYVRDLTCNIHTKHQ